MSRKRAMKHQWKLRGKCASCKKVKMFIGTRTVPMPNSPLTATSQDLICGSCYAAIIKALRNQPKHE